LPNNACIPVITGSTKFKFNFSFRPFSKSYTFGFSLNKEVSLYSSKLKVFFNLSEKLSYVSSIFLTRYNPVTTTAALIATNFAV
jgi:hypothetical protein